MSDPTYRRHFGQIISPFGPTDLINAQLELVKGVFNLLLLLPALQSSTISPPFIKMDAEILTGKKMVHVS
ncbi:MAG: hypothetical protein MUO36_00515, partial [Candidatus Hadarchaeum sp.]|nr:hypothetical protein [Candidatus Hadarchaeum sp.]